MWSNVGCHTYSWFVFLELCAGIRQAFQQTLKRISADKRKCSFDGHQNFCWLVVEQNKFSFPEIVRVVTWAFVLNDVFSVLLCVFRCYVPNNVASCGEMNLCQLIRNCAAACLASRKYQNLFLKEILQSVQRRSFFHDCDWSSKEHNCQRHGRTRLGAKDSFFFPRPGFMSIKKHSPDRSVENIGHEDLWRKDKRHVNWHHNFEFGTLASHLDT